ncbi:Vibriobactin utilization protein ViuB [Corynebacterium atrinae]|uniref:siderophore-interacting protein n=1 Tax=Corynebacterium atrinae TaxID=1336740 RepID=UPI0025B3A2F9|nr:siderophore-interacting protein [Corynebacterium atrinae]WJY63186.1 Vibriobactin utilization protein ViuB [Corynebacterium atrinae]
MSHATVTAVRRLTNDLVRISFDCPDLVGAELPHTDHYIKIVFGESVTRTYTFRRADTTTGRVDIDFVTHGDEGLAGPWAQRAQVGDTIEYRGPGGAWHPGDYDHFVLAGDESAAPAIAAGLDKLPAGASAEVYIEVETCDDTFEMPEPAGVTVHWVPRQGATHGTRLSEAVRAAGIPPQRTGWFIHGVAEMIKEMRRFLFIDGDVDRKDVSISGYWRIGMTEDQWQASKREFNAELDAAEQA